MLRPGDHDAELSEEEFRLLRDFIHEQFGLFFDDGAAEPRCGRGWRAGSPSSASASFEDYYRYLRFAPEREPERQRMVAHLTNNETYFFREQPQLQVFADDGAARAQGAQEPERRAVARASSPRAAPAGKRR